MWDNSVRIHQSTENANSQKEKKRAKMINNFNFCKIDTLSQYDIFILIIGLGLGDFTIILPTGIAH